MFVLTAAIYKLCFQMTMDVAIFSCERSISRTHFVIKNKIDCIVTFMLTALRNEMKV